MPHDHSFALAASGFGAVLVLGLALAPAACVSETSAPSEGGNADTEVTRVTVVAPAVAPGVDVPLVPPDPAAPTPRVLAQGLQAPRLLRLDRAAAVVVTRAASGEPDHVIRIDRHGGGAVDLGAAESPLADLALGAGVVWWSEPQAHALVAVPLAGGVEPTRLTVAGRPVLVATDGERLVWVCEDGEMGFRGEDRSIRDLGRVGGEPRALVLTETEAFVNLVDGRIVRVALAAKIETVAKHQAVGGGFRRWGGDLYYFDSEAREVRRLDLVSFAVTTVAAPGDGDFTIAPARRHVYLADSAQGLVRRTPRETAGSSELVAQTQGAPSEIEMWGDWMVWIDEGSGDLVDLGR